ncbi:MAG: hypothetical protein ACK5LP_01970 [Campylobacteraceae bacterium]
MMCVKLMQKDETIGSQKIPFMLSTLIQQKNQAEKISKWYGDYFNLKDDSEQIQKLKLAFLATEGAMLLRKFGFLKMTNKEWKEIFSNIDKYLL